VVAGKQAAGKVAPILNILRTEPELYAEVWAVTFQSERRWDVHLRSGIRVRLPESDPRTAWSRLAMIDHTKRITDRDLAVIDMRVPDQMIVEPNIPVRGKGSKT
jgi:cell division protein FtsQ